MPTAVSPSRAAFRSHPEPGAAGGERGEAERRVHGVLPGGRLHQAAGPGEGGSCPPPSLRGVRGRPAGAGPAQCRPVVSPGPGRGDWRSRQIPRRVPPLLLPEGLGSAGRDGQQGELPRAGEARGGQARGGGWDQEATGHSSDPAVQPGQLSLGQPAPPGGRLCPAPPAAFSEEEVRPEEASLAVGLPESAGPLQAGASQSHFPPCLPAGLSRFPSRLLVRSRPTRGWNRPCGVALVLALADAAPSPLG